MADHSDNFLRYLIGHHQSNIQTFYERATHNFIFITREQDHYPPALIVKIVCGLVSTDAVSLAQTLTCITLLDIVLFHKSPAAFPGADYNLNSTLDHVGHQRLCRYVGLAVRNAGTFLLAETMFEKDHQFHISRTNIRHRSDPPERSNNYNHDPHTLLPINEDTYAMCVVWLANTTKRCPCSHLVISL